MPERLFTDMRFPDFIIIGAQKCGTSSVHQYLGEHPEFEMPRMKETQFFDDDRNWVKGPEWYSNHFSETARFVGESSPQYTWLPWVPNTAERMHSLVPDAKLIYMVRDPVDRVLSQYVDFRIQGHEFREFDELFDFLISETNHYVEISRYFYQLESFLEYFPSERLRVWTMEDLAADPYTIMREITEYIGADSGFESPGWTKPRNSGQVKRLPHPFFSKTIGVRGAPAQWSHEKLPGPLRKPFNWLVHATGSPISKPKLSAEEESALMDLFRDDVAKLRDYSGNSFSRWRNY